jgi:DNA modification methylase
MDAKPKPYYQDDYVTLYHGDCRDILPHLEPVDLVLTDPPYGIGYDTAKANKPNQKQFKVIVNDDSFELAKAVISWRSDNPMVIFGAINFPKLLPSKGRWICWDKRCSEKADKMLGSPFELAWSNRKSGYDRMYRILHGGVVNANGKGPRFHPTEKPIVLMQRIIEQDYKNAEVILDPFAGSGTTLIAVKRLGKKAIGIEIEEKYCELAASRLRQEVLPL